MNSFLFTETFPELAVGHLEHKGINVRFAAATHDLLAAPEAPMQLTAPRAPAPGQSFSEWEASVLAPWVQRETEYRERAASIERTGLPTPEELLPAAVLTAIDKFYSTTQTQFSRVATEPGARADFSSLPYNAGTSCWHGLSWDESVLPPQYRGVYWQCSPEKLVDGRCTIVPWSHPSSSTSIDLPRVYEELRLRWDAGERDTQDLEQLVLLVNYGLPTYSTVPARIRIAPNHKPFWPEWRIARDKAAEKSELPGEAAPLYFPPRATDPQSRPIVPGDVVPRSVANLTTKPRQVTNMSFDPEVPFSERPRARTLRRQRASEALEAEIARLDPRLVPDTPPVRPAVMSTSLNACTDWSRVPDFSFLRLEDVGRAAAILMTSGLALGQSSDDLVAWYEQLPRVFPDQPLQQRFTVYEGFQSEVTGVFGVSAECHTNQAIHIPWMQFAEGDALRLQYRFEVELYRHALAFGLLSIAEQALVGAYLVHQFGPPAPDESALLLTMSNNLVSVVLRWAAARRAAGGLGKWGVTGVFFDDSASVYLLFWGLFLKRAQRRVYDRQNVAVADGAAYHSGAPGKNKSSMAGPGLEISQLGQYIDLLPPGSRTSTTEKRQKYELAGRSLLAQRRPRSHRRGGMSGVVSSELERVLGQLTYLFDTDPPRLAMVRMFRSTLPGGWASFRHTYLSDEAAQLFAEILDATRSPQASALCPRPLIINLHDPDLWYHVGDAAKSEPVPGRFVGFGGLIWRRFSHIFYLYLDQFTPAELSLDPTSLELLNSNIGADLAGSRMCSPAAQDADKPVSAQTPFTLLTGCDNKSVAAVVNTLVGRSPPTRALARARAAISVRHGIRSVGIHLVRETLLAQAADDLSRGLVSAACSKITEYLGFEPAFEILPIPATARDTSFVLQAVANSPITPETSAAVDDY